MGLVACVRLPELFLQISLFVFDHQFVHQWDEYQHKRNPPHIPKRERKADQHEHHAEIDRVAREAIDSA